MIYPRLKLAKDLLTDDGVIFISIDDNEVENLRKICDEVFGEQNFIANFIWQSTPGSHTGEDLKIVTEDVLLYAKHKPDCCFLNLNADHEKYVNQDEFCSRRGGYVLNKLDRRMTGSHYSEALNYSIKTPDGTSVYPGSSCTKQPHWNWRWSAAKVKWGIENGFIVMKQNGDSWSVYFKQYEKVDNEDNPIRRTVPYQNLLNVDGANSARGTAELMDIFDGKVFDYPKPIRLIAYLQRMVLAHSDIVLDFFSGSATTAHAVMQLNAKDGGNRKFIMVQLPERTDEKSEAYKAGYKNICEIGKERIRRAGAKIVTELKAKQLKEAAPNLFSTTEHTERLTPSQNTQKGTANSSVCSVSAEGGFCDFSGQKASTQNLPDIGFRVLKCDTSNMKEVYYNPAEYEASLFSSLEDNIKTDRTSEDLLFQVMLDLGVLLSSKIEETAIAGKKVFNVADNYLIACFDSNVAEETIKAIAKQKPYYFVMRDSSLASDSVATNFDQIFSTYSPDTIRKVL